MSKFIQKFNHIYAQYVIRPLRIIFFIVFYFFKKILFFCYIRGIYLPGLKSVNKHSSSYLIQKTERQKLIYELKSNRFHFRFGPLWFRRIVDLMDRFIQKNKFIFFIVMKSILSCVYVFIPIFIFVLLRGILPVPDRIPYENIKISTSKTVSTHIDYPYNRNSRSVSATDTHVLQEYKIGFLPFKMNLLKGFSVSEKSPLILNNNLEHDAQHSKLNRLNFEYYFLPRESGKVQNCIIQVFNDKNELLAQNTINTPQLESASEYSIRNSWRRAFTPNIVPSYGKIEALNIAIDSIPNELVVKTFSTLQPTEISDSLQESCSAIVSNVRFAHKISEPLPKRGVVFIVVDGLQEDISFNKKIFPKLTKFMSHNAYIFKNHYTQSSEADLSVRSLLTSKYPSEITKNNSADNLGNALKKSGYRVGAVGTLMAETGISFQNENLGFEDATLTENSRYNGRYVTEMTGQWLKKNAQDPFFLYVHYNSLNPPYKPPFEYLDVSQLMAHPMGDLQKQELYLGVARYFDDELSLLFQKLEDLELLENIDIILTGNPKKIDLENQYVQQKSFKVPLWIRLANTPPKKSIVILEPTAHLDLFPSIYSFMTKKSLNTFTRGINFSNLLQSVSPPKFLNALGKRNALFFEDAKIAGILNPNTHKEDDFYVRFLESLPQKSSFTYNQNQNTFQKNYFTNNISEKLFKIHSGYNGKINMTFTLLAPQNSLIETNNERPELLTLPEGVKFNFLKIRDKYKVKLEGSLTEGSEILINIQHMNIANIQFDEEAEPFLCPEGIEFAEDYLADALNSKVCPYFAISTQTKNDIVTKFKHPLFIQMLLKNEQRDFDHDS